jgi:thiosulfate reductase cytochrome b subunit
MSHRVLIYRPFERFWHWTQALLIILLGITGFEVHGSYVFLGYATSVRIHQISAWAFIGLIAFAIFWHFVTGQGRQYLPEEGTMLDGIKAQARYYLVGIFRGEPPPFRKTELSKLNPLQKATYLGFKILLVPIMVTTGLLYMFYNSWPEWLPFRLGGIATVHVLGAFLLLLFFIVHVYMTTTGVTPLANIKAMLAGYEELEDDDTDSVLV